MSLIRKIINAIKSNKYILMVFLGILIIVWVLIRDFGALEDRTQDPSSRPYEAETAGLYLVNSTPFEGQISTLDPFDMITFEFSAELDPDSIRVEIAPRINHRIIHDEEFPNQFSILPKDSGWKPRVKYMIKVTNVEGVYGEILRDAPIKYNYENLPPDMRNTISPF